MFPLEINSHFTNASDMISAIKQDLIMGETFGPIIIRYNSRSYLIELHDNGLFDVTLKMTNRKTTGM